MLNNDWEFFRQYPAVFGHEVIGRVTAAGSAAKGIKVGQRVGIGWTAGSCMHCRQCKSGDPAFCARASRADDRRPQRRLCQPCPFTLAPGRSRCPRHSTSPKLVRSCAAGITVFNPLAMYAKPTSRVGIVGIGGLGHMGVKFAAAYGCDVTAFTSSPSKFEEARGFGANHVVATRDPAAIKKLARARSIC